jgi:hypothetical protein
MSQVVSWCGMRHETHGKVAAKRSTVQPRITGYTAFVEWLVFVKKRRVLKKSSSKLLWDKTRAYADETGD